MRNGSSAKIEHMRTFNFRQAWSSLVRWVSVNPARRAFMLAWIPYGLLSFLFGYTHGLAFDCGGVGSAHEVCYVQSGNDDVTVIIGAAFSVGATAWGLFRSNVAFGAADFAMYGFLLIAQAVYLGSIESGSIVDTILLDRNAVLAAWMFCYLLLCILFLMRALKVAPLRN